MADRVIVIGAGLAGITAAYYASGSGAQVILIDRGTAGLGTNSAMSNGVFAGTTSSYGEEQYVKDTIQIGRRLNKASYVKSVAGKAKEGIRFLRSLGLDVAEKETTYSLMASSPGVIPGVTLMKTLASVIGSIDKIKILDGFYVTAIIKHEGIACGIRGFDKSGKDAEIHAPSTILAAGGAGAIYFRNDNQKTIMGQGYRLAAEAGLALKDMEFVQFYPIVVDDEHLASIILYPPTPKMARLISASGEDILQKHGFEDVNQAILQKRDAFAKMLFEEAAENGQVFMDFSRVSDDVWHNHPMSIISKLKKDIRSTPVAVSPATHFFMGGVEIDENGQTSLPGLFACGEVVWGLHGANRRGGNALTECLVTGRIAGQNAAEYSPASIKYNTPAIQKDSIAEPVTDIQKLSFRTLDENHDNRLLLKELRRKIRSIAWNNAGIIRSEGGIKNGLEDIISVNTKLYKISPKDVSEMKLKEDLLSASFVLNAILLASLARRESRGSFFREDFKKEDDANWLKNSVLSYNPKDNAFEVDFVDVL